MHFCCPSMMYLHTWETNLHILNVPCSHHAISTPAHILGGEGWRAFNCMTHDGWGRDKQDGPEVDVAVRVCVDWVVRKRFCYHLQAQIMGCSEMAVQVRIHAPISSNKYHPEPKLPLLCMERICLWRASDRVDAYIPFQSAWILVRVLSPSHGEGTMTMAGGKVARPSSNFSDIIIIQLSFNGVSPSTPATSKIADRRCWETSCHNRSHHHNDENKTTDTLARYCSIQDYLLWLNTSGYQQLQFLKSKYLVSSYIYSSWSNYRTG